jgi:hypothetical protein
MKHPNQATLALHAGGDLGWVARWKTGRHLAQCPDCRRQVAAYTAVREILPELREIPEVPWNRIAADMRANIRLGLEAGECVRGDQTPVRDSPLFDSPLFTGARAAVAFAGIVTMVVTGFVLEHPSPAVAKDDSPMVRAMSNGIQKRAGDRAFGLMHAGARSVTYTVGAQGTLGARYMDPETGYVTMTKVYVE